MTVASPTALLIIFHCGSYDGGSGLRIDMPRLGRKTQDLARETKDWHRETQNLLRGTREIVYRYLGW